MIYPVVSTEEWSELYKVVPVEGKCPKCGIDIIADKPFADGRLRGFISEDHGCGIEKCLATFNVSANDFFDISEVELLFNLDE